MSGGIGGMVAQYAMLFRGIWLDEFLSNGTLADALSTPLTH